MGESSTKEKSEKLVKEVRRLLKRGKKLVKETKAEVRRLESITARRCDLDR